MGVDLRTAYLEMHSAGRADYPPQCLEYVHRLILVHARLGNGYRHLPAGEVCQAFQRGVAADFGKLAPQVLQHWRVNSFHDLGKAVFLLADYRCLALEAGDSLRDYENAGAIRLD
jgi:uncharacterized repeat protein (TIGR04138 family)